MQFKVGPSPSKKKINMLQLKPIKIDEKCFLLYHKSSFRSGDIYIFFLTFWSCINSLIRNISLISKFMTSQPG